MKVKSKGSNMTVKCGCQGLQEVPSKQFYAGGLGCKTCGEPYRTVPSQKPDTHKSSRERHAGHSHVKAETKTKKDKQLDKKVSTAVAMAQKGK